MMLVTLFMTIQQRHLKISPFLIAANGHDDIGEVLHIQQVVQVIHHQKQNRNGSTGKNFNDMREIVQCHW